IEKVIDLHTAVRDHFGGASCGRGQRRHQELGVISNQPMASLPGPREPQLEGFPWSLAESHMGRRIVNIVKVLCQVLVESGESPYCMLFRINGLGDLPHISGDLGVARQVVDERSVYRAEQALADGAKARLCRRP